MKDLGKRIDLHTHSLLSDGLLLPSEVMRYAAILDHEAIAITDHVDYSNIESVMRKLKLFEKNHSRYLDVKFIPGVEITHADPRLIPDLARLARDLGAKIVVCHGETVAEPVIKGTDHIAVKEKGLIDILAHPGNISEEDAALAAKNGVYLELTSKKAHGTTNKHVAIMAKKTGAKLIVNTDAHRPEDYLTQESAFKLAKNCGLSDTEALAAVKDNPKELLSRIL